MGKLAADIYTFSEFVKNGFVYIGKIESDGWRMH